MQPHIIIYFCSCGFLFVAFHFLLAQVYKFFLCCKKILVYNCFFPFTNRSIRRLFCICLFFSHCCISHTIMCIINELNEDSLVENGVRLLFHTREQNTNEHTFTTLLMIINNLHMFAMTLHLKTRKLENSKTRKLYTNCIV